MQQLVPDSLNVEWYDKSLDTCLKVVKDIGADTYMNVCTGQEAYVPWGSQTWLGFFVLVMVCCVFTALIGYMFYDIRR